LFGMLYGVFVAAESSIDHTAVIVQVGESNACAGRFHVAAGRRPAIGFGDRYDRNACTKSGSADDGVSETADGVASNGFVLDGSIVGSLVGRRGEGHRRHNADGSVKGLR
jgi:hypothetical protein